MVICARNFLFIMLFQKMVVLVIHHLVLWWCWLHDSKGKSTAPIVSKDWPGLHTLHAPRLLYLFLALFLIILYFDLTSFWCLFSLKPNVGRHSFLDRLLY